MTEVINITTNLVGNERVRDGLSRISGELGGLAKVGATAIAGFAAASVAGFSAATAKIINYGDELSKLSIKTGASVEALSQLKYAADLSDVSLDQLGNAFKFMSKAVAEAESGTGAAAKAFDGLNINYEAFKNLKPEDQFTVVAEKLSGVKDASEKTQLAMALFGRAGVDMLPMLNDGAAGLEKLRGEADSLGLTMTTDSAKAMEAFNDSMTTLGAAVMGAVQKIVVDFAPALVSITQWLGDIVPAAAAIFTSAFEGIRQVILRVSEYALFAFGKMAQAIGWLAEAVGVDAFSKWGDTLVEISDSLKLTADSYNEVTTAVVQSGKEHKNLDELIKSATGSTYKNVEAVKALSAAEDKAAEKRQKHFEDAAEAHKEVLRALDEEINAIEKKNREADQGAFEESARIQRMLNEEIESFEKRDQKDAENRRNEEDRRTKAINGMSAWERAWKSYEAVALGVFGTVSEHMVGSVADSKRALGTMFGDIFTKTESVGDAIEKFFGTVKDSILRSLGEILADKIWQELLSIAVGGSASGGGGAGGGLLGSAGGSLLGGAAGGSAGADVTGGAIGMEASAGASAASAAAVLVTLAAIAATIGGLERFGPALEDWIRDDPLGGFGEMIVGAGEDLGGFLGNAAEEVGDFLGIKNPFAAGTDAVFNRPTMFIAGENGPERVQVTPTNQFGSRSGGGIAYNFYGPVVMDQITMDKFQRGLMQGMAAQSGRFA